MTTRFWYQGDAATEEVTNVRKGTDARGGGWGAMAQIGEAHSGSLIVDDPSGTLSFVPWRRFRITEDVLTATVPPVQPDPLQRIWTGFVTDVKVRRGDNVVGSLARVWELTLLEENNLLHFRRVLSTWSGNRPAETDIARLNWWLGTEYVSGQWFTDLGYVDESNPVNLDAHDYTWSPLGDVLADLSNASGKNHHLVFHHAQNHWDLWYQSNDSSDFASPLRVSNVAADVDNITTFAPYGEAELTFDASRMYSALVMPYTGGTIYRTRTLAAGEIRRDGEAPAAEVKSAATATTLADRELEEIEDPEESISFDLVIHRSRALQIRVGQLIDVKFSHFPGYTSFTDTRIRELVIRQDLPAQDDDSYHLSLVVSPADVVDPEDPPVPTDTRLVVLVGHNRGLDFSVVPPDKTNDGSTIGWTASFGAQIDLSALGQAGGRTQVWYASLPVGTTGLVWDGAAQSTTSVFYAFEVKGVSGSTATNYTADETGATSGTSGSVSPSGDALLIGGVLLGRNWAITPAASWTERFDIFCFNPPDPADGNFGPRYEVATRLVSAGSYAYTPSWSDATKNLCYIASFPEISGETAGVVQSASAGGAGAGFNTLTFSAAIGP